MKKIHKSGEDYLEAIYKLLELDDHAHSADIARALGVTKPSTFKAMQNLADSGYVIKESYGAVTLTERGRAAAEAVIKKHRAVKTLLTDILGVSADTAERDACKIEHCLSEETTEKLFGFLNQD